MLFRPSPFVQAAKPRHLTLNGSRTNDSWIRTAGNYSTPLKTVSIYTSSIPTWIVSVCDPFPIFVIQRATIEFLATPDVTSYACISAFSPPEERIAAYAHIQKEIQAMEAAIRALKVRHNSLNFISRLPAELLSWIFELLALSEDTTPVGRKPHCVGVSHVCSQWRHIALECPRLWTHIQCPLYPRWAMEMLKRSKMAPITVKGLAY